MASHYSRGLQTPDRKLYKAVAEAGGWKSVRCEILTTFAVATKEDLWTKENSLIRLEDPNCLNTFRAIQTSEERAEQVRETKRRSWKKWVENPEFKEAQRKRQKELYARRKEDPEFLEKRRATALASYYRRKGKE